MVAGVGTGVTLRSRVILVGPPGSGKGTQSALLAERAGLATLSTGDLLRSVARQETLLGRRVESCMASGALLPDRLLLDVLAEPVRRLRDSGAGFVLDGFPRTLAQAVALDEMLTPEPIDVAVQLVVDAKVVAARLASRGRDDDHASAIEQRLLAFERETRPVIERYRCSGRLVAVDGHQPVETVYAEIVDALELLTSAPATTPPTRRAAALHS
jgi:adenylate kinase